MKYKKSSKSHKGTECSRLADHIYKAAIAMGLKAKVNSSQVSASEYVYVSLPEDHEKREEIEAVKIRCSDHEDVSEFRSSDWYVEYDECPSETIERLAEYFQKDIPAGFRSTDYLERSIAANKATLTRKQNYYAKESEMVIAVVESLRLEKTCGKVTAGKVIDELLPGIPYAQRSRIAYSASKTVSLEREHVRNQTLLDKAMKNKGVDGICAMAFPYNVNQEPLLGIMARELLFKEVGEEKYLAMRPKGFPRQLWFRPTSKAYN